MLNLDSMRVDLVGSLLRPEKLKQAFADWGQGKASEADLKSAQDEAICQVVAKQVAHNLPIVVDGEFRRGRRRRRVASGGENLSRNPGAKR